MTQVLQVGNRIITTAEILPLLTGYQLLPQLWREIIIDSAIAPIELTPPEQKSAIEQFNHKHQLTNIAERQAWAARYGMTQEQLEALATREWRIQKFQQITWGQQLESDFLTQKSQLDKVIYSLLRRTTSAEVAQELYFRISAGEQSFAELARDYSTGSEAQTGGLVGPVELNLLHPELAKLLAISHRGQLWSPTRLGEWFAIVRLEQLLPAVLDEPTRQQLLNRQFEAWLEAQLQQLHSSQMPSTPPALVAV